MGKDLVIIAGAGDVGSRLAALRIGRGDDVIAIRRRDVASGPGVRTHRADLASGEGLEAPGGNTGAADYVFFFGGTVYLRAEAAQYA